MSGDKTGGKDIHQQKRLYSIKELVKHIGATEWFWRTQIWNGDLAWIQVGKKMFVAREDVESFITTNRHQNIQ